MRSKDDYKPEVRHRQPDAAILDHERKRKIEVKCLELQVQLEDADVGEDEIAQRVEELREKLTAQNTLATARERGSIKP